MKLNTASLLALATLVISLMGCVTTGGGTQQSQEQGGAQATKSAQTPTTSQAPSAATAQESAESDPNFIRASKLSPAKFEKLWGIATNKCYDLGYAVANSDRSTRNLICTTQNKGNTLTLRVRFADEGIYVTYTSSAASWKLLGGDKIAYKAKQHSDMKNALIAGLK